MCPASAAPDLPAPTPVDDFSHCHAGIVRHLDALADLPDLLDAARRARSIAQQTLAFFRDVVIEHHADEERELFPAVLASAKAGAERDAIQGMVERLTAEHRQVEAQFKRLEAALKKAAKGQDNDLSAPAVAELVRVYKAHAAYEEANFLPRSQHILGRDQNHMAALGVSLHMRHARPIVGHI